MTEKISLRKKIGGILAASILLAALFVPATESLSMEAKNTLFVTAAVIIVLVTEALPLGIGCLTAVPLLYFYHCVPSLSDALVGFTNPTLFFVLASFGVSTALTVVPVSKRLLIALMKRFGNSVEKLLLAIMAVTAIISSVISNVAAAAIFIPTVKRFLTIYENEEDRKNTARCFMIALPMASMIGGMTTPAGSSSNILAISLLESYAGKTIPFAVWMAIGIPLVLVLLPFTWFVISKVFKPAALTKEEIDTYILESQKEIPKNMQFKEKYVLFVLFVMLVLWIASSWVPFIQVAAVAIIGIMFYFLPGKLNVMSWKDFNNGVSLEAFVLMGVMISLGSVISKTGLAAWISAVLFPKSFVSITPLVIAFVCLLIYIISLLVPVAPALVTMLAMPVISFCEGLGVSPVLGMLVLGLCAGNCYLLPLDTVPVMTYSTGAYDMFDMPKASIYSVIMLILLCSLWAPFALSLFGVL